MKTIDKLFKKSCFANLKKAKKHIFIFINCILLTISLFFMFAAFNINKDALINKYLVSNDNLIVSSKPENYNSKKISDYEEFDSFTKIYNSYYNNASIIEYDQNVKELFVLKKDLQSTAHINTNYDYYFPVAISSSFIIEYEKNTQIKLEVDDVFLLANKNYYNLYGEIEEIFSFDEKTDKNIINEPYIIVGNNYIQNKYKTIGFDNIDGEFIFDTLGNILKEYDEICYANSLYDLMYEKKFYASSSYSIYNNLMNASFLNLSDENKTYFHSLSGKLPQNKNEIVLPKEIFYAYFEENKNIAEINNFYESYNNIFPCKDNDYISDITIVGYYETINEDEDLKNKNFIIISDELFDELFNNIYINPSFSNIAGFAFNSTLLKNIINYLEENKIEIYDNNLYVNLTSALVLENTIYMLTTIMGVIIFITCLFGLASFIGNYITLNEKNMAKMIFSSFDTYMLFRILFLCLIEYLLSAFLIGLFLSYILNSLLSFMCLKIYVNVNIAIPFNYLNIFTYTTISILTILLIIFIFMYIKQKYFYKKIGDLFK